MAHFVEEEEKRFAVFFKADGDHSSYVYEVPGEGGQPCAWIDVKNKEGIGPLLMSREEAEELMPQIVKRWKYHAPERFVIEEV